MLNLFYLCDPILSNAINNIGNVLPVPNDPCEGKSFPFVCYVWGGDDQRLSKYKTRFSRSNRGHHFFFDTKKKQIQQGIPTDLDSARHTQGLKHTYVVPYLSTLI